MLLVTAIDRRPAEVLVEAGVEEVVSSSQISCKNTARPAIQSIRLLLAVCCLRSGERAGCARRQHSLSTSTSLAAMVRVVVDHVVVRYDQDQRKQSHNNASPKRHQIALASECKIVVSVAMGISRWRTSPLKRHKWRTTMIHVAHQRPLSYHPSHT